jgi:hypothetical protein
MQLIGPNFSDAKLLGAAIAYQDAYGAGGIVRNRGMGVDGSAGEARAAGSSDLSEETNDGTKTDKSAGEAHATGGRS